MTDLVRKTVLIQRSLYRVQNKTDVIDCRRMRVAYITTAKCVPQTKTYAIGWERARSACDKVKLLLLAGNERGARAIQ